MKDYYQILGVNRNADEAEIKQAYRKMAKQYHPDKNPGNKQAEQKFKDVNEAFGVLGNKTKRQEYDTFGTSGAQQGFSGDFSSVFEGFGDIFGDIFGGSRPSGRQREALRYRLTIDFAEACSGIVKNVKVPIRNTCERCKGSGAKDDKSVRECSHCGGSGVLRMQKGMFSMQQTCRACGGRGSVVTAICPTCGGEGETSTPKEIRVTIPAGINDGDNLRLKMETSDLFVEVQVRPHPFFFRDRQNLLCEIPISFVNAALGGTVEFESLQGKLSLRIPPGTQSGKIFRLRGKGVPYMDSNQTGDLLCTIRVETPINLNSDQQALLRKLDKSLNEDKMSHSPSKSNWKDKVRSFFH